MRGLARVAAALLALAGCAKNPASDESRPVDLTIVAGSENKSLEPVVQQFCQSRAIRCVIKYKGSLDIGMLTAPGNSDALPDAVWPASSIWIDLYDSGRKVKHLKSIYQTPVILGVDAQKARQLGWVGKTIAMDDVVKAIEAGQLPYLMTSATQSNSGASAYLAMLSHALGGEMNAQSVSSDKANAQIRALLGAVQRSSGSSGWLKDLYVEGVRRGINYSAMWNYEFIIREANEELAKDGKAPLIAIYPTDGMVMADSPLGFIDTGRGAKVEENFLALQAFLLDAKGPARAAILASGRRIAGKTVADAAATKAWNWQPGMTITNVGMPEPAVIRAALTRYQEVLRKPSLSIFCLDKSGSMEGEGIDQLHKAVSFLFNPQATSAALVQWSNADRIGLIAFDATPGEALFLRGDASGQGRLLEAGNAIQADGGTNMYACGIKALEIIRAAPDAGKSLPAIIMMTDGRSEEDNRDAFMQAWRNGAPVPVFGVTFGDADADQLDSLAKETGGRVFDGSKNLAEAFRSTRGYN